MEGPHFQRDKFSFRSLPPSDSLSPNAMTEDDGDLSGRHHFHYLTDPQGSFVLISPCETVETAVVFVHGFGGDAAGTWAHFQQFVDDGDDFRELFAAVDLYFVQYQAVWESINSSADRLGSFIAKVVFDPESPQFQVPLGPLLPGVEAPIADTGGDGRVDLHGGGTLLARPAGHRYRTLVIGAHSEGGVVVRQTILRTYKNGVPNSPLYDARLALFAPALFGYEPSGVLGTIMNFPGLGRVIDACLRSSPAYRDLQRDSKLKLLPKLQRETEALQDDAIGFRASLVWGRKDRILQDGQYAKDDAEYKDDLGHIAICKPTGGYDDPIVLVASKLK